MNKQNDYENILKDQVICLSIICSKLKNLKLKILYINQNQKFPIIIIKDDINTIDFSYFITNNLFNKNYNKNLLNDWRALNILYLTILEIKININDFNKNNQLIPILFFNDFNYINGYLNILVKMNKDQVINYYNNFINQNEIKKDRRNVHEIKKVYDFQI